MMNETATPLFAALATIAERLPAGTGAPPPALAALEQAFGQPLPETVHALYSRYAGGEVWFDDGSGENSRMRPSLTRPFVGIVRLLPPEEAKEVLAQNRFPKGWVAHDHLPLFVGRGRVFYVSPEGTILVHSSEEGRMRLFADDVARFVARLAVEQSRVENRRAKKSD